MKTSKDVTAELSKKKKKKLIKILALTPCNNIY